MSKLSFLKAALIMVFMAAFVISCDEKPTPDGTVDVPVTSIEITPAKDTIVLGETLEFKVIVLPENATNKEYSIFPNDTTLAKIDGNKITARKVGNLKVTAISKDGAKQAFADIVIKKPNVAVQSIEISPVEETIAEGRSVELSVKVLPEDASNPKFTLSAEPKDIVSIEGLKITGLNPGIATITATTEDGAKTATCKITVLSHEDAPKLASCGLTFDRSTPNDITFNFTIPTGGADRYWIGCAEASVFANKTDADIIAYDRAIMDAKIEASEEKGDYEEDLKTLLTYGTYNKAGSLMLSEFISDIKANTEYVIYAYGIELDGYVNTEITRLKASTKKTDDESYDLLINYLDAYYKDNNGNGTAISVRLHSREGSTDAIDEPHTEYVNFLINPTTPYDLTGEWTIGGGGDEGEDQVQNWGEKTFYGAIKSGKVTITKLDDADYAVTGLIVLEHKMNRVQRVKITYSGPIEKEAK